MRDEDRSFALAIDTYNVGKLFGGRWDLTVLALLRDGPYRPRDLVRMVAGLPFRDHWSRTETSLSQARITETLRVLTQEGLVRRTRIAEGWDRAVEYSLTDASADLLPVLERLQTWLRSHPELFDNAGASPLHRRADRASSTAGRADGRPSEQRSR